MRKQIPFSYLFSHYFQKSLWDSIKNKRAANPTSTPRCKNNEATLKITANKTFQVPRKAQYQREKPRSPLTLFNEGVALRERSLSETKSVEDGQEHQRPPKATWRPKGLAGSDQAQVRHAQENTPVLLLVPAAEHADLSKGSAVLLDLLGTSDHLGSTRVLNRTLSPVGTPEAFRRLMPHIQSLDSPVIEAFPACENVREPSVDPEVQPLAPALTLSDALALIDSDLHTGITHSSCDNFSDSLESANGSLGPVPGKPSLNVIPDSPDPSECNGQRCTFFVSKNETSSSRHGPPTPVIFPFTSPPELSSSPIHPRVSLNTTSLSSLPPSPCALPSFFRKPSSPVSVPLMVKGSSSPAGVLLLPVCSKTSEALPPGVSNPAGSSPAAASSPSSPPPPPLSKEVLMFPVHTKTQLDLAKNKKRKSDEYLRSEERVEDVGRPDLVKRSRVVATTTRESMRPVREKKRAVEKPQRQHSSAGEAFVA